MSETEFRSATGPKALVSRRQISSGHGPNGKHVVIEETWDISAPDCPFVVTFLNGNGKRLEHGLILSQTEMPEAQWLYGLPYANH